MQEAHRHIQQELRLKDRCKCKNFAWALSAAVSWAALTPTRTCGLTISFRCSTGRCCRQLVDATAGARKRSRAPGDTREPKPIRRRLIEAKDIDLIDICVPNVAHKEISVAAAQAGKMVVCEKPLAMNVAEAEAMVRAVKTAGVANMIFFNYRRVPAISLAKQLIDEGRIGRAFHYRATYLQDWTISPDVPQGGAALWRLDVADAGSGVTGDLLAHSIDTAMWLNGPVRRVVAKTETFVKERRHAITGRVQPVGIDDACMFLAEFANGSLGTFESTRYARGRKNFNTFELNGADGSLYFDLEEPEYLQFFEYREPHSEKKVESHLTGWRKIHVTNSEHPYMSHYWVPGTCIGYEHTFLNAVADFVAGLEFGHAGAARF